VYGDVMAENDVSLKQRNSHGVEVQIKLVDGRDLHVLTKKKKSKQRYSVDILSLQDKSKKTIFVAWKWLFTSVVFFLLTLSLLKVLPAYLNENKNLYLAIILFSGGLGVILSFVQFWKHTSRILIFRSRHAHIPIITLRVAKPTKEIFSTFVDSVEQRIKKIHEHMNLPEDKQLVGEMKMLRRLCDENIITKKEYESAKSVLFSGFDSQVVNRDQ
jgi:hypothetical protein